MLVISDYFDAVPNVCKDKNSNSFSLFFTFSSRDAHSLFQHTSCFVDGGEEREPTCAFLFFPIFGLLIYN